MTDPAPHTGSPDAAHPEAVKDLPDDERVLLIRSDFWAPHPAANSLIAFMNAMLDWPPSIRRRNLLIIAPPNNGKSATARHFCAQHPILPNLAGDTVISPVVAIEAPSKPSVKELAIAILDALNVPFRVSHSSQRLLWQAATVLKNLGTRLLIIDEIQQSIAAPGPFAIEVQRALQWLSNRSGLSLVCVGTPGAARALAQNEPLWYRFYVKRLEPWRFDEQYVRFLAGLEARLPLRRHASFLESTLPGRIYELSEGRIGAIIEVVNELAILAIRKKRERITESLLKDLEWTPPSKRLLLANSLR